MLWLQLIVWQQQLLLVGLWLLGQQLWLQQQLLWLQQQLLWLQQQLLVGQSFLSAVVVVLVVVAMMVLHKLVPQQVGPLFSVPTLSMKGRLLRAGAATHMFEDVQPKAGEVVPEFVTVDKTFYFFYFLITVLTNNVVC